MLTEPLKNKQTHFYRSGIRLISKFGCHILQGPSQLFQTGTAIELKYHYRKLRSVDLIVATLDA